MSNPFDVSVELRGTNRVANQLRAMASAHPDQTDPIIGKHAKWQAKQLRNKAYPPELPGQVYVRTHNLKRRFRARRVKKGVHIVMNRQSYAVWVIKKGMQATKFFGKYPPGHRGRWWTIDDQVQKNAPTLTKKLAAMLEDLMRKQKD